MILKIKNLNFKFKDKVILENSNINFYSNKITGIVGKNGVGKTTFFNLINNKYDFEGNIFLDNNTMNSLDVILVNSVPNLPDFLTGEEYIKYFLKITNKEELNIKQYLEMLNFNEEDLKKLIIKYSHGMKNKLEILIVILLNPKVKLLDEPITNLDIISQEEIKNILLKLKEDHIVIISTHLIDFAMELCDEIVLMNDYKLTKIDKNKKHIINSLKGTYV